MFSIFKKYFLYFNSPLNKLATVSGSSFYVYIPDCNIALE